ncbi:filament-like plant protein [Wolffia australiana]
MDCESSSSSSASLAEQLRAKDELIREHARVSEEAVSGWEKAALEASSLRDQLEEAARENFALKDLVLDREQRFLDELAERTDQWGSEKFGLEDLVIDLEKQLEMAEKNGGLRSKIRRLEMENGLLRLEILSLVEQLEVRTAERDLNWHRLLNIKKAMALESECRRLSEKLQMEKVLKEAERKSDDLRKELLLAGVAAEEAESRARDMEGEVRWLEKKLEEERVLSADLNDKCRRLEKKLLSSATPTGDLTVDPDATARKLEKCKNTIASMQAYLNLLNGLY